MRSRIAAAFAACVIVATFAGCAPQEASNPDKQTPNDAGNVTISWSPDVDCALCHSGQGASMEDAAFTAHTHSIQGNTCTTCHQTSSDLEAAHSQATSEGAAKVKSLKSTDVPTEVCLGCHKQEDLSTKTSESTVLTDSQGTTVNPHAIPENNDHAATTCQNCHSMHSSTPVSESAPNHCKSCHHQNVYECYTCHE